MRILGSGTGNPFTITANPSNPKRRGGDKRSPIQYCSARTHGRRASRYCEPMLSYRHAFHAGNFADVHKHAVVTILLTALQKKDAGLCYLDTHGGAGRYDLRSSEADKNAEYQNGIARIWLAGHPPPAHAPYLAAIKAVNEGLAPHAGAPRYYPGSPRLARTLLRPQDRIVLTELR